MSFDTPLPPYTASDSHATFLNVSCLDLLLIEMVPLAERMARRAERIEQGEELREEDDGGGVGGTKGDGKKGRVEAKRDEVDGGTVLDEEVYRDAIFIRLDGLGYRVGQGLSERYVFLSELFLMLERLWQWKCELLPYVRLPCLSPLVPRLEIPKQGHALQAFERPSKRRLTGQTSYHLGGKASSPTLYHPAITIPRAISG